MIEALAQGEEDPITLASLARGQLRTKLDDLKRTLDGMLGSHQRMLLSVQLEHIDFIDGQIAKIDTEIEERMRPLEEDLRRLETITGVGRKISEEILSIIGDDMSRFPSAHHLAFWAKVCPGNGESAGKRKSGRIGRGNALLRGALVEAAWAASHTKHTYLSSYYRRLASRRGRKRALVALAHTILVIVYHILKDGTTCQLFSPLTDSQNLP